MTVRVLKGKDNRRVFLQIERLEYNTRGAIHDALYDIGRENVRYTRALILDRNKTGRIYIINGRRHQASAPGEAPANLSGRLMRSVDYVVRGFTQMEFGDRVPHGRFLELGTDRIDPRPHLSRTIQERQKEAINTLEDYTNQQVIQK